MAIYLFKKASEQGVVEAQCALGICYGEGKGVRRDRRQALYWLQKAAEQGNEEAKKILSGGKLTLLNVLCTIAYIAVQGIIILIVEMLFKFIGF